MSNNNDPNLGFVGGVNGFEEWACDDFNLLEYVGQDNSPFENRDADDFGINDEDDSLRKKDMIYSTLQYNNALLSHDQPAGKLAGTTRFPTAVAEDEFAEMDDPSLPSTSKTTTPVQKLKTELELPNESFDDNTPMYTVNTASLHEDCYTPGSYASSSSFKQQSNDETFMPKTKPRKYRIKAEYEKRNPQYRAKREKNNDAVRRSRDKAKKMQEEKEDRLTFLESETVRQNKVITQLRQRNEFLEDQLISMKRSCTCRMRC